MSIEIVQLLTCVMVGGSARKSARGSCDGGSVVALSRSARGTYQEKLDDLNTRGQTYANK